MAGEMLIGPGSRIMGSLDMPGMDPRVRRNFQRLKSAGLKLPYGDNMEVNAEGQIQVKTSYLPPIYGNSATDTTLDANGTLTAVNHYHNLTINAGKTIQSATTRYGPLVIVCSGKLTIAGTLHADAKAELYSPSYATWMGNGGVEEPGWGVEFGVSRWDLDLNSTPGGRVLAVPGGGGIPTWGYISNVGLADWTNPLPNYALLGCYNATQVALGQDGGDIITTPIADFVDMFRDGWLVGGCGGGAGSSEGEGGHGGGCIRIFAREVEIVSGGILRANGGDGGDEGPPHQAGGGGGGGILIVTGSYTNNGTVEAAGGTGAGTAGDGADGIVQIVEAV